MASPPAIVAELDITVVVASRHGSTREVADVVAETLRGGGHRCAVVDAERAGSPIPGDAVVVGSPIYMGRWMKDARLAADELAREDGRRRIYAFSCGPLGDPPEPEAPALDAVLGDLANSVRLYEQFTGKLDTSQLNRRERLMARAVKAPEGDFRDFEAVRDFAKRVADDLASGD